MEKLLDQLSQNSPNLVVMVILVFAFFKRDKERDLVFIQRERERDAFLQQLHQEHLAARGESRAAINKNSDCTDELTKAVITLPEQLRRVMELAQSR